jgi:hypothetical protein
MEPAWIVMPAEWKPALAAAVVSLEQARVLVGALSREVPFRSLLEFHSVAPASECQRMSARLPQAPRHKPAAKPATGAAHPEPLHLRIVLPTYRRPTTRYCTPRTNLLAGLRL